MRFCFESNHKFYYTLSYIGEGIGWNSLRIPLRIVFKLEQANADFKEGRILLFSSIPLLFPSLLLLSQETLQGLILSLIISLSLHLILLSYFYLLFINYLIFFLPPVIFFSYTQVCVNLSGRRKQEKRSILSSSKKKA
jgi:hypothetical protein